MWKRVLGAAVALMAFVAAAGTQADADREKISEHFKSRQSGNWTWVFYGDSITHGAAHTKGWRSFVEIFQERVRYELGRPMDAVINSGNSGQTSVNLLNDNQYQWQVRRFKPDVVLILIGCNDIVRKEAGGVEDFRTRLEALVNRVRADGAIPVLQTYNTIQLVENPTSEYLQGYVKRYHEFPAYNQVIRDTAEKLDVLLVDHTRHWEKNAADPAVLDFWLGETIHPGPRGHQEMAVEIFKALDMYAPSSKCSTLEAGGPAPAAELSSGMNLDMFSQVGKWAIDYSAENGLPPADLWKNGYPAGRVSIVERDGGKALRVDSSGLAAALFSFTDRKLIGSLSGTVLIEMELALPEAPADPKMGSQFYFAFSGGGDRMVQSIIALGNSSCGGNFGGCSFGPIPYGQFFKVRIALDLENSSGALWINDQKFVKSRLAPMTKVADYLYFGDGGKSVDGKFELRSLRVGAIGK